MCKALRVGSKFFGAAGSLAAGLKVHLNLPVVHEATPPENSIQSHRATTWAVCQNNHMLSEKGRGKICSFRKREERSMKGEPH